MTIVRENIRFERGQEPLTSMGIGKKALDKKTIEETDWDLPLEIIEQNFDIVSIIRDLAQPALILKSKSDGDGDGKRWVAVTTDYRTDYYDNAKYALGELIGYLNVRSKTNESQNFTQHGDPLTLMGIGSRELIKSSCKNIHQEDSQHQFFYKIENELKPLDTNIRIIEIKGLRFAIGYYSGSYFDKDGNKVSKRKYSKELLEKSKISFCFSGLETNENEEIRFSIRPEFKEFFQDGSYFPHSNSFFLGESQNFTRYEDPKATMGIGKKVLVENWLHEMGLYFYNLNADLSIDYSDKKNGALVNLEGKIEGGELPSYIQFNIVWGGFNISKNHLKTLRGCPIKVKGTANYKGNFKCFENDLMSLEHAPKLIEGNFIAYKNPGNFTRGDVTKVCKVLSKTIWVDTKKTNEGINFERDLEPMDKLEVGEHYRIKQWLKEMDVPEDTYKINPDGTIDIFGDINIVANQLEELPEYINFGKINGSFYAAHNKWKSLRGFPKEVNGDLSLYSEHEEGQGVSGLAVKKWKDFEVRSKVKIHGELYN